MELRVLPDPDRFSPGGQPGRRCVRRPPETARPATGSSNRPAGGTGDRFRGDAHAELRAIGSPRTPRLRPHSVLPITKLAQYRTRPDVPAGPTDWGIPIHVFRIASGAGVKEGLNRCFAAERGRPMKRRFGPGPTISHECAG